MLFMSTTCTRRRFNCCHNHCGQLPRCYSLSRSATRCHTQHSAPRLQRFFERSPRSCWHVRVWCSPAGDMPCSLPVQNGTSVVLRPESHCFQLQMCMVAELPSTLHQLTCQLPQKTVEGPSPLRSISEATRYTAPHIAPAHTSAVIRMPMHDQWQDKHQPCMGRTWSVALHTHRGS